MLSKFHRYAVCLHHGMTPPSFHLFLHSIEFQSKEPLLLRTAVREQPLLHLVTIQHITPVALRALVTVTSVHSSSCCSTQAATCTHFTTLFLQLNNHPAFYVCPGITVSFLFFCACFSFIIFWWCLPDECGTPGDNNILHEYFRGSTQNCLFIPPPTAVSNSCSKLFLMLSCFALIYCGPSHCCLSFSLSLYSTIANKC